VGCFFTGGVDSFFTYLRHRNEVTDLIFVHGYDVDLDDLPRRAEISAMGRAIEQATGVRFIELETNAIRLFVISDVGARMPMAMAWGAQLVIWQIILIVSIFRLPLPVNTCAPGEPTLRQIRSSPMSASQ